MRRTPDGLRHRTTEFRASAHGPCRTDKWSYPHPSPPRARDRRWRDLRCDPVVRARSRILKCQVQRQASGQGNGISWNGGSSLGEGTAPSIAAMTAIKNNDGYSADMNGSKTIASLDHPPAIRQSDGDKRLYIAHAKADKGKR